MIMCVVEEKCVEGKKKHVVGFSVWMWDDVGWWGVVGVRCCCCVCVV